MNDAQESMDKFIDEHVSKMFDRAFNASSLRHPDLEEVLRHVDLDDSTLGKTAQLAGRASPLPMSRVSAPLPTSSRLPLQGPPRVLPSVKANQAGQQPDIEQFKQQLKTAMKSMDRMDPAAMAVLAGALAPGAAHAG